MYFIVAAQIHSDGNEKEHRTMDQFTVIVCQELSSIFNSILYIYYLKKQTRNNQPNGKYHDPNTKAGFPKIPGKVLQWEETS